LIFEVTSGKKLNEAEESGVSNFSVDFVQRVVFEKKLD
jgi:pimeloyl-CoA synthetase